MSSDRRHRRAAGLGAELRLHFLRHRGKHQRAVMVAGNEDHAVVSGVREVPQRREFGLVLAQNQLDQVRGLGLRTAGVLVVAGALSVAPLPHLEGIAGHDQIRIALTLFVDPLQKARELKGLALERITAAFGPLPLLLTRPLG